MKTSNALLLVAMMFSLSCDDKPAAQPARSEPSAPVIVAPQLPTSPPPPVVRSAAVSSVVSGVVKLNGKAPVMKAIDNKGCHPNAKPIMEETVLTNSDGSLRNVIVYVKDVELAKNIGEVVINQVDCQYSPHVVAMQKEQTLVFKSSDPTLHNVHTMCQINPAANFGMVPGGPEQKVFFTASEIMPVTCDVHPWMRAYVGVFDNPFFSVTADAGKFEIKSLPKGSYTLVAWHENYGTQQKQIEVPADDAKVEVNFEFK